VEDMVEALKAIADFKDDSDKDRIKLTTGQYKLILMTLGEKMNEHQIDEILTDSDTVLEDSI